MYTLLFKHKYAVALFLIIIISCFMSLFSSSSPDGLEFVTEKLHIAEHSSMLIIPNISPFPDYQITSISNSVISNIIIGCIGLSACFGITFLSLRIANSLK